MFNLSKLWGSLHICPSDPQKNELRESKLRFDEKQAKLKEERLRTCIAKYGSVYGKAVAQKELMIGMTTDMCLEIWGWPEDMNTTVTAYGKHSQWVYSGRRYLYFDNDKLTAVQY